MNGSLIGFERHEDEELMTEFSASKKGNRFSSNPLYLFSMWPITPSRTSTAVSETFDLRAEQKKNGSLAPINIPTSTFDSFLKCAREGVINSWIESAVQVWSVQEVTTEKIQATAAFDVHTLSRTQMDRYTPTKWLRGDIALPHGGDKCGHIRNWIFVLNLSPGLGCFCCDIWRVMEISYQSKSSSFKDYLRPETHTHTYTF